MKALSIRAPWWWLILHAGKDIENRDWPTGFRGTVLIHASKWFNLDEVISDLEDAAEFMASPKSPLDFSKISPEGIAIGSIRPLGGHVVGSVEIVGCVQVSDSKWFQGKHGFVLVNPKVFDKPWPVRGMPGLFDVAASAPTEEKLND